jgi:hypothetical protein
MTVVQLVILLICLGALALAIQQWAPLEARIKGLILWVLVIVAVVIVLSAFGILDVLRGLMVPRA